MQHNVVLAGLVPRFGLELSFATHSHAAQHLAEWTCSGNQSWRSMEIHTRSLAEYCATWDYHVQIAVQFPANTPTKF
jgi:hypothetical protein